MAVNACLCTVIYGRGVEEDKQRAIRLYKLSADSGDRNALYELGHLFKSCALIEKDIDKAVRLFELSGKNGCGEAQLVLGRLYKEGEEVSQDLEEAARLFRDAAYSGLENSSWGFFKCKDLESREM